MTNIKSAMEWLGKRLGERSSWLGLTATITSLGLTISPDLQEIIIQTGVAIGGLIAFFMKDKTIIKK